MTTIVGGIAPAAISVSRSATLGTIAENVYSREQKRLQHVPARRVKREPSAEASDRACAPALGLDLSVARSRRRDERVEQVPRRVGDLGDSEVECLAIRLRRLLHS